MSTILDKRRLGGVLAAATATSIGLWLLDHCFLRIPVLTPLGEQAALSPLYAFYQPVLRLSSLLFPLAAVAGLWRLPRCLDPDKTSPLHFGLQLFGASLLLPLLLFLVRQALGELGQLLTFYPGEEVYYDALRISRLGNFYRRYVEIIPNLSLHGRHFPPGHATWIYAATRVFGESVQVVACFTLLFFALGMLAAYRALGCLLSEDRARQGAVLCLACPSVLDFACTSMDAVFFASAALSLWLSLRALQAEQDWVGSALAAAALFLSSLLSYSALPLGLVIVLYGLFRFATGDRSCLLTLLVMGATFLAVGLLFFLLTGFSLLEAFLAARERNVELMTQVIGRNPLELYPKIAYGNGAAFVIGSGVALSAALWLHVERRSEWKAPFPLAVAAVFAVLILGGIHQMETERIWIYTLPWLAAVCVASRPLPVDVLRILLAAGLLQAYLMEVLFFTLW